MVSGQLKRMNAPRECHIVHFGQKVDIKGVPRSYRAFRYGSIIDIVKEYLEKLLVFYHLDRLSKNEADKFVAAPNLSLSLT